MSDQNQANGESGDAKTSSPQSNSSANGRLDKKSVYSWALYDRANSAFATTLMAAFFPLFFKQYWASELTASESTFQLGLANSVAGILLAISAPLLGAIADVGLYKKRLLLLFASIGAISTAGLYFVGQGQWQWAAALYVLASLGFFIGNIFYDALLVTVTRLVRMDFVSGLGYSLGYLGGSILFSVNVAMFLKPDWFSISSQSEAIKWAFISVAAWWALFSIPLALNVHEGKTSTRIGYGKAIAQGLKQIATTFKSIRRQKAIFVFLLAYMFYYDGVNTIIKMAVDYGMALGFEPKDLITALLITNYVAFPSALAFGYMGEKWGAKRGIAVALVAYICITIWGYSMDTPFEFYIMAGTIGLFQGGIQALSRSYFAQLIPHGQQGEYFGFFNMIGKFSAVLGPSLVGAVSLYTKNPRLSILVIVVFFLLGGGLLKYHHSLLQSTVKR